MKNIQIILLFLLSFSLNAQQKLILNLSDFNIQGKVKSFTLKTKNYQNPNKIGKEVNTIYVQMDPDFISKVHPLFIYKFPHIILLESIITSLFIRISFLPLSNFL